MATNSVLPTARRELASRTNDDLEVTLWWDPPIDAVSVSVWDWKRDAHFEITVERDHALDVFYHPFAYASRRKPDEALAGAQ